jgi:hypothetical protein
MIDRLGLVVSPGSERPATVKPKPLEPDSLKGGDVYHWAIDQAALIRAQRYDEIDWTNVADEIESVAKSELRSLTSNILVVLEHMLKWDYQPQKRSRSWALSISEHRARVEDDIADSPSLKKKVPETLARAYRSARTGASIETGLPIDTFPAVCPYDWDAIMTRPFVLDQTDEAT